MPPVSKVALVVLHAFITPSRHWIRRRFPQSITDHQIRRKASNFMKGFAHYRDLPFVYLSERPKLLKGLVSLTILACYIAYFVGCLVRHLRDAIQC